MDLSSLNPERLVRWLTTTGLQILIIISVGLFAYLLLSILSKHLAKRIKQLDDAEGSDFDKRTETILRLVRTSGLVIIIGIAFLMILDQLGIDIRPILASVGIISLALGLGAQTLVKDVIGGFFIIMEGQFHVGDVIEFGDITGTVENLTLRVTKLRDAQGTVHFVPNGELRVVSNRTRGWSRATVDIGVPYEQDISHARLALEEIGKGALQDSSIAALLIEEPSITGIERLDDWRSQLRLTVKTLPNQQWEVQRYFRQQILEEFARRGISIAHPRQQVILHREN